MTSSPISIKLWRSSRPDNQVVGYVATGIKERKPSLRLEAAQPGGPAADFNVN